MTDYNRPDHLPAWAESGDKVQPTNSEIQTGWPLSSVPPSRQRFNWLLNWLANGIRYLLQLGVSEWNEDETYRIGSRVQYDGLTYKALTANTNKQPDTNAADWERWGYSNTELLPRVDSLLTKSVAGSADVTLTATEANNGILVLTGTLTGSINVIVPNSARRWAIHNGTSGSYKLYIKTASGSAVEVAQGKSVTLYCDGSNVCRLAGASNDMTIGVTSFTATAGQTSFSLTYDVGTVFQVVRNGAVVGYTASSGTAVVLDVAATLGDTVKIYTAAASQLFTGLNKGGDTATGPITGPISANETTAGMSEVATQAETDAGTDDQRFVTPAKLRRGRYSVKADGYVDTTTPASPFLAFGNGITSIARTGTGVYVVTLADTYAATGGGVPKIVPSVIAKRTTTDLASPKITAVTTSTITIKFEDAASALTDPDGFFIQVTGVLA